MKKLTFATLAAAAAFVVPTAASAQDAQPEVTIGASAGIHDLGVVEGDTDIDGFEIDDSGAIFGGFIAVDFPVGESFFVGIEGNAHIGTDAIEAEYGASARAGFRASNGSKFYVRGGYQEVDLDAAGLIGVDGDLLDEGDLGIDTTVGDYLVGAGADFPIGESLTLRANVDTIAFDTVRATAGIGFRF